MVPATLRAVAPLPSKGRRTLALVFLVVPALLIRLWIIRHLPEPDTDAAGHLGIARAVLSDPTNIAIHWVYLPAYHFVLAALLLIGMSADAIRVTNAVLAAFLPALVLRYAESTADRQGADASPHVPWMAAVFCAVSPLVNLLGTSAQQETLFTLLVVGAVWSIDRRRLVVAGALLALASLIRYEAWGAVALLVATHAAGRVPAIAKRLPAPIARICSLPLVFATPSIFAVGAWFLAHRLRDGQWFAVVRELYRYTHAQREDLHRDLLWFPVEQPLFVFGSVVAILFFTGFRRAWRPTHVVPLGIYVFLIGAYAFKGALGSARYYESLTPFVALAAAHGASFFGRRWRWMAPAIFVAASLQLVGLSTQLFFWTWPSTSVCEPALPTVSAPQPAPAASGDGAGGDERITPAPGTGTRAASREARAQRR